MLVKSQPSNLAKIKVIGVGGAGGNAINNMIRNYDIEGVEFIAVNTDSQALSTSSAEVKLQIGAEITRGLGSGGNPSIGKKAAEESVDMIHENLAGADMVFITAGMGGGTGTGASPIIAGIAKNLGALTIAIVEKPFLFEGKRRMETAIQGISEIKDKVDTLIVIPNQKLLDMGEKNLPFLDALKKVDDVLAQAVKSISQLINHTGLINLDFADIKSIMSNAGTSLMGIGEAEGSNKAIEATRMAIHSPLLEFSIKGAKGVVFNIIGGKDLGINEVSQAAQVIQEEVHEDCNIVFGANIDPEMNDSIRVTVIATGFDPEQRVETALRSPEGNFYQPKVSTTSSYSQPVQNSSYIPQQQPKISYEEVKPAPTQAIIDEEPKASSTPTKKKLNLDDDLDFDDDLDTTPAFLRRKKNY